MRVLLKIAVLLFITVLFPRCGNQKATIVHRRPVMVSAQKKMGADKILVFTKTNGYRHGSIKKGVATLMELGTEHNFQITHTEDSLAFNTDNLNKFKLIIFLSTTIDILGEAQEKAFKKYRGVNLNTYL